MRRHLTLAITLFVASACGEANASSEAAREAVATNQVQDLPTVLVYKTPTCGCCNGWIDHLREEGFTVDARDVTDIMAVKRDGGVPPTMSSCHTAIVDGYVVEGHVPADQLKRLLAERPQVAGIAVPGMPVGSPGMEGAGARPYQVLSFDHRGEAAVFAEIDPR